MARVLWLEQTPRHALELDLDGFRQYLVGQAAADLGFNNASLSEVNLVAMRVGPVFNFPGQPLDLAP